MLSRLDGAEDYHKMHANRGSAGRLLSEEGMLSIPRCNLLILGSSLFIPGCFLLIPLNPPSYLIWVLAVNSQMLAEKTPTVVLTRVVLAKGGGLLCHLGEH